MERHYFSAANTPLGFYSCFDQVIDRYRANRVYYIKGGSGCGKSTFMKKIGEAFNSDGECEYFHCSSDIHSLDGIHIPQKKVAVFDGTAPHIQDPILCGAADELIDFGAYLNKNLLEEYRAELFELIGEKNECFKKAYCFLRAAEALVPPPYTEPTIAFDKILTLLKDRYDLDNHEASKGTRRHLFADGFTPQGKFTFCDRLFTGKIIKITGDASSRFLDKLGTAFSLAGYDVDFLQNPLRPHYCDHLLIHRLSLVFSTSVTDNITEEIRFSPKSECLDADLFAHLIEKAISSLRQAKELHDRVEDYYLPAIDFSQVDQKLTEVLEEIRTYPDHEI